MQPGVHNEAGGAEGLGVEHADPLRVGLVQLHLLGQPFAVEAPALRVCSAGHPRAERAERRQAGQLHLDGQLEVMTRSRLVERDRGDPVQLSLLRLIGVQVVLARARSVDRGRHVEGGWHLALPIFLHRRDDAVRPRQAAEVARRRGECPRRLLDSELHDRLARRRVIGRVLGQRLGVRGAISVAGVARDLVLLSLDVRQVLHPKPMDFVRGRIDGGVHADAEPVRLFAAWRGGDARLGTSLRFVFVCQERAEPMEGRDDVRHHRRTDLLAGCIVCNVRHRHGREGLARDRHHPLDLLDLLADRNARRGAPVGDPLAQRLDRLLDRRGIGGKAGQQAVKGRGRIRDLVLRDLHRHGLDAEDVIDRQLVLLLLQRLEVRAGDQHEHVARDHLLGIESVGVDRLRVGQCLPEGRRVRCTSSLPEVGQHVIPPRIAQDRGVDRVALQDTVPETVGQLVDGKVWLGHRPVSPRWDGMRSGVQCSP